MSGSENELLKSSAIHILEEIESGDEARQVWGFEEAARLAAFLPEDSPHTFGFLDHALFCARKHASGKLRVRRALVFMLAAIAEREAPWRDAVLEAVSEIAAQPADDSRETAGEASQLVEGFGE